MVQMCSSKEQWCEKHNLDSSRSVLFEQLHHACSEDKLFANRCDKKITNNLNVNLMRVLQWPFHSNGSSKEHGSKSRGRHGRGHHSIPFQSYLFKCAFLTVLQMHGCPSSKDGHRQARQHPPLDHVGLVTIHVASHRGHRVQHPHVDPRQHPTGPRGTPGSHEGGSRGSEGGSGVSAEVRLAWRAWTRASRSWLVRVASCWRASTCSNAASKACSKRWQCCRKPRTVDHRSAWSSAPSRSSSWRWLDSSCSRLRVRAWI
mmetsp:Transcript_8889/g.54671  ORF Transcript_8889/g.54671 Transcript_8889/m.54671 type:complete len:259 (+) Transcript_8889:1636-2412(+)